MSYQFPSVPPPVHEYNSANGLVLQSDLKYSSSGGSPLRFDLIAPVDYRGQSDPVFIFVHGGAWSGGDKNDPWSEQVAVEAARLGFVTLNVNYRLNSNREPNPFPAATDDVRTFLLYLHDHLDLLGISPDAHVTIAGQSAGGHLALFAATDEHSPFNYACVVDIAGPSDLTARDFPDALEELILSFANSKELRAEASPVNRMSHFTAGKLFIIHADDDEVVPVSQSRILVKQLEAVQSPAKVRFIELESGGHAIARSVIHDSFAGFLRQDCR